MATTTIPPVHTAFVWQLPADYKVNLQKMQFVLKGNINDIDNIADVLSLTKDAHLKLAIQKLASMLDKAYCEAHLLTNTMLNAINKDVKALISMCFDLSSALNMVIKTSGYNSAGSNTKQLSELLDKVANVGSDVLAVVQLHMSLKGSKAIKYKHYTLKSFEHAYLVA
jgi:hypothetical protein